MASTVAPDHSHAASHCRVSVHVAAATEERNRLTSFFRFFLAIPHLILVGFPLATSLSGSLGSTQGEGFEWSGSAGLYGLLIFGATIIAWFAILFSSRHPEGLYRLAAHFLRWRVRAGAYAMLLTDDYPPFGDGPYPAALELERQTGPRDFTSVLFRMLFVLPQLVALWALGIAWTITTIVAWFSIVFTGRYPEQLFRFGVGALRWSVRVEAYLLLLHDEYPPFTIGR